jgi:hypothetical protein
MDDKPALTTSAEVPIAENQISRTARPRGHTFSDIKEFANEQGVQIFAIGTLDFGACQGKPSSGHYGRQAPAQKPNQRSKTRELPSMRPTTDKLSHPLP